MEHLATWVRLAILAVIGTVWLTRRRRRGITVSRVGPAVVGTAEGDRATLSALRDAGADLAKATEVNFYLYFPTRAAAELAAIEAGMPELSPSVEPSAIDDGTWCLLLTGQLVPTEAVIRAAASRLEDIAVRNGGEYDGWEAKVTE